MNTATAQPMHRSVTAAADRRDRMACGWLSALACALLLAAGVGFAQGKPDPTPPFLSESVAPNLIISFDNSESMRGASAPSLPDPGGRPGISAYWASPDVNKLYYDPTRSYEPGYAADGSQLPVFPSRSVQRYPYGVPDGNYQGCPSTIDLESVDYRVVVRDAVTDTYCYLTPKADDAVATRPHYYRFRPHRFYKPTDDGAAPHYLRCNENVPGCIRCGVAHGETGDENAPDVCFEKQGVEGDEQLRNFGIWYAYYRTRMLTAQTIISQVMQTLDDDVRLTFQAFDYALGFTPESDAFKSLVDEFDVYGENRNRFYAWLHGLPAGHASDVPTPLAAAHIRAGEFVSQGISMADDIAAHKAAHGGSASGTVDPSSDNACGAKCRANFHLVLTDGGWTDRWGTRSAGFGSTGAAYWPVTTTDTTGRWIEQNQDGESWPLESNPFGVTDYIHDSDDSKLYADEGVGMLADVAFYYWRRDLNPGVEDQVPPLIRTVADGTERFDKVNFWNPRNDPATWQHLSLFSVGLGVEGAVEIPRQDPLSMDYDPSDPRGPDYGFYNDGQERTLREHGFPDCVANPPYTMATTLSTCNAVNYGSGQFPSSHIDEKARVDDLYHAALNARGDYFDALNADALAASFTEILAHISAVAKQQTANAPVAITAGSLSDSTRIYQAVTDSEDWTGEVRGVRVSTGYNCSPKLRGEFCEELDDPYQTTRAEGSFPAPSLRKIYTMADGSPAVFDNDSQLWDKLSTAQQRALMDCLLPPYDADSAHCTAPDALPADDPNRVLAEDRIDWLRGEEVDGFRERETPLGDILGSGPLVVGPPRRLFADPDYQTFKTASAGRDTMVYVGANDGMLHAFNADSEAPKLEEVFAYVPEAVYANLADLSNPAYGGADPGKKAYVDGPINVADAKFSRDGGNKWGTVLVGALGAGAQGLYALDITDPTLVDADAAPESLILWEFTDASGSDDDDGKLDGRDMGYNIWKPAIVRITDPDDADEPTWVVLVGNGFASTSTDQEDSSACTDDDDLTNCTISQTGNAVLYVLNIGGADENRILARLDTGHGDVAAPNGLAEVSTLDTNGDLIADRAYAGDLYGNVWRFDLTDLTEPPTLMFTAKDPNGNPQPITSRIVFTRHPYGGYMLLFGTGRFVYESDKMDHSVQTFYGIWDRQGLDFGDGPISTEEAPIRDNLIEHELIEGVDVLGDGGGIASRARTSTKEPVVAPSQSRGWMIDLVIPDATPEGERVVVAPQVRRGHVTFTSMIPGDCCEAGGSGWDYTVGAIDGSRPDYIPFDYNRDGSIDQDDLLDVNGEKVIGTGIEVETGIPSALAELDIGGGKSVNKGSKTDGGTRRSAHDRGLSSARTWLQID
jgi:type IV pilus assembly protein PilY1